MIITEYESKIVYEEQYFVSVPEVAWNFYFGNYQPAQKWLKDSKGKVLDFNDIIHYQKMIKSVSETNRLMKKIDVIGVER